MSGPAYLTIYSILILLLSMCGGYLPFLGRATHSRLQLYLSISAGVMLGASFFHVMPEAMEHSGVYFGWWMSLGVVGLFCIERFIAPHSHEIDGGGHLVGFGGPQGMPAPSQMIGGGHHHHHGDESHQHDHKNGTEHRAAAPAVAGWMAVLGLTIHTFMNGVGLAGSVDNDLSKSLASYGIPGLAMFLAIFLHKPADALAISTVLTRKRVTRRKITWVQLGYVAMIPAGAYAFCLTSGALGETLKHQLTGFALAFCAGTFIFIALSDLLPEVQFHRHDRVPLFLTLLCAVLLMGGIAWLESLTEGKDKEESAKPVAAVRDGHRAIGHPSTSKSRNATRAKI